MARTKTPDNDHQITIHVSDDIWRQIEVYWHGKLFPTRTAALRELLTFALAAKLPALAKETKR